MKYIEIKAPAKINIGLAVLSKRIDGYHNLHTLFYPVADLYDTLTFEKQDSFLFECDAPALPVDNQNLVVKAKRVLEKYTGRILNVKIELRKSIPVEAGLGGGSSDAAATLISLNELFSLGFNYEQLIQIALELGSDVPFFLKAQPAIGKSRGELLELINLEIPYPILIVNPGIPVSTRKAFEKITPNNQLIDYASVIQGNKLLIEKLKSVVRNDFENAVFEEFPEIGRIKSVMETNGALFAQMSGSGSTVYGIFGDESGIEKTLAALPKNYFWKINTPAN